MTQRKQESSCGKITRVYKILSVFVFQVLLIAKEIDTHNTGKEGKNKRIIYFILRRFTISTAENVTSKLQL